MIADPVLDALHEMSTYVRTTISDRVAVIELHDPERRNAINLDMNRELIAVLDALEVSGEVGAIVVTGAPTAFCAGADLAALESAASPGDFNALYAGFVRLAASPLPTVAAVNGAAVGAGLNMALACDLILAGESARFESRFLKIGLHPGGGHTWRVERLAGVGVAQAMVLFGEVLSGQRAAEVGLAWSCIADDALMDEAIRLATRAANTAPPLVARTKETLAGLAGIADADGAVEWEIEAQAWSAGEPAFRELVASLRRSIRSSET